MSKITSETKRWSDVDLVEVFERGYSKGLNALRMEVFKIIKWSKDHGNNDELISKKQVARIIDTLLSNKENNG